MYNVRHTVKNGIKLFAYAVLIIQACFALVWIAMNFGYMPPEHISLDYLKAAKTLVVDDYMSILYALILWGIKKVAGNDTCLFGVLLVLQLLAVFFSVWTFPGKLKKKALTGLFLITNPFVLAACNSLNVYAFCFAALVAMAGCVWSLGSDIKAVHVVGFGTASLISLLLVPELVWFEAIILVPAALIFIGLHGAKNLSPVVLWLLAAVVAIGVNMLVPKQGAYGRGSESAELYIMQYFPGTDIHIYADEMENYCGYENSWLLKNIDSYEERFLYEFAPEFERLCGTEKAKEFYRHLIDQYLARGMRKPTLKILKTVGSYAFPLAAIPVMYTAKLSGTHLPWLISNFTAKAETVSKIYLLFGCMSSLILAISAIAGGVTSKYPSQRKRIYAGVFIVICLGVYCMFCNPRGFDFRLCLIAATLFPFLQLEAIIRES